MILQSTVIGALESYTIVSNVHKFISSNGRALKKNHPPSKHLALGKVQFKSTLKEEKHLQKIQIIYEYTFLNLSTVRDFKDSGQFFIPSLTITCIPFFINFSTNSCSVVSDIRITVLIPSQSCK